MPRARLVATWFFGLIAAWSAGLAEAPALADLIDPQSRQTYPDLTSGINGSLDYRYDPTTQTGQLQVKATPYLLSAGPSDLHQFRIALSGDGLRSQQLTARLDERGLLVVDPANTFEIYGSVDPGSHGAPIDGLLLKGTPIAFGAKDLGSLGVTEKDTFDLTLKITDGLLAEQFGEEIYLRLALESDSTFQGRFTEDFRAEQVMVDAMGPAQTGPVAVPEPSAWLVLFAGGLALWGLRSRRRVPRTTV